MSQSTYVFKDAGNGIRPKPEDAEAFVQVIESLRQALKREVTKEDVLDVARPATSPIHHLFTWDDSTAAEAWRLYQARQLLRAIRIRVTDDDGSQVERRLLIAIPHADTSESHDFVPRAKVLSDDDLRARAFRKALDELEQWQERYAEFHDEFLPVFKAIGEVIERAVS